MRLKYRLKVGNQFHYVSLRVHPLQSASQLAAVLATRFPLAASHLGKRPEDARLSLRFLENYQQSQEEQDSLGDTSSTSKKQTFSLIDPGVALEKMPIPVGSVIELAWVCPADLAAQEAVLPARNATSQEAGQFAPMVRYSPTHAPRPVFTDKALTLPMSDLYQLSGKTQMGQAQDFGAQNKEDICASDFTHGAVQVKPKQKLKTETKAAQFGETEHFSGSDFGQESLASFGAPPFPWVPFGVIGSVGAVLFVLLRLFTFSSALADSSLMLSWVFLCFSLALMGAVGLWHWRRYRIWQEERRKEALSHVQEFVDLAQASWQMRSLEMENTWPSIDRLVQELINDQGQISSVLWSVPAGESQFLKLRLGFGVKESGIKITPRLRPELAQFDLSSVFTPEYQGDKGGSENHLNTLGQAVQHWENLPQAPILADFSRHTALIGSEELRDALARSLLTQAFIYHGPTQLEVVVITARPKQWQWTQWWPHASATEQFLGRAPLCTFEELVDIESTLHRLLTRRSRAAAPEYSHLLIVVDGQLPAHSTVGQLSQIYPQARLSFLYCVSSRSQACGPYQQWIDLGKDNQADATVENTHLSGVLARWKPPTSPAVSVHVQGLDAQRAVALSLGVADLLEATLPLNAPQDLPVSVSFWQLRQGQRASVCGGSTQKQQLVTKRAELLDTMPSAESIRALWAERGQVFNLEATLGFTARGIFRVDLAQCDSALVSGGPIAYRQALIATWLVQMATCYSAEDFSFILLDSEEKAAEKTPDLQNDPLLFGGLKPLQTVAYLPHCVAVITQKDAQSRARLIHSLKVELSRRSKVLAESADRDFNAAWKNRAQNGKAMPFPALILALSCAETYPAQFLCELIGLQHTGRGLGFYLILGASGSQLGENQNPQDSEQIASAESSTTIGDEQGSGDTAKNETTQQGSGLTILPDDVLRSAGARLTLRQGCAEDVNRILGGNYQVDVQTDFNNLGQGLCQNRSILTNFQGVNLFHSPSHQGLPILLNGQWENQPAFSDNAHPLANDFAVMVDLLRQAGQGLPPVKRPWLPPLKSRYLLSQLPATTRMPLGVCDDLDSQVQRLLTYLPEKEGPMAVVGPESSGKTSALRMLARSADLASTRGGGPYTIYVIETLGDDLSEFYLAPRVAAYLDSTQNQEASELLHWLENVVATRLGILESQRLSQWSQVPPEVVAAYPSAAGTDQLLVLIDDADHLNQKVSDNSLSAVLHLLTGGCEAGVHLLISAKEFEGLPVSWRGALNKTLQLGATDEQGKLIPGRGYLNADARALQLAFTEAKQKRVGTRKNHTGAQRWHLQENKTLQAPQQSNAPQTERKEEPATQRTQAQSTKTEIKGKEQKWQRGPLASEIPSTIDDQPILGVSIKSGEPLSFKARGLAILAGDEGSGKTNAMRHLADTLRKTYPQMGLVLLSAGRSELSALELWDGVVSGAKQFNDYLPKLAAALSRVAPAKHPGLGIFIDDFPQLSENSSIENKLLELLNAVRAGGHFLLGSGQTQQWYKGAAPTKAMIKPQTGLLLNSSSEAGVKLWGRSVTVDATQAGPGRGWWITPTEQIRVQIPLAGR